MYVLVVIWCESARRESNPYVKRRQILNSAAATSYATRALSEDIICDIAFDVNYYS